MPGIFGGAAIQTGLQPGAIVELMKQMLTHQPWYSTFLKTQGSSSLGAVSNNPHFSRANHFACRREADLLIEGTAMTLDGAAIADDHPELASQILNAYCESSDDFVHRLGGHFNLAVRDHRNGHLHLINDRSGFAHLYFYKDDEVFLFGPELKVFLAWENFNRNLNEASFASLLTRECPLGTETLFEEVQMLGPGSHLVFDGTGVQVKRYWQPETQPETNRSDEDWLQEAAYLYQRAVDKRLPNSSQGRILLPLSGGLDSRLLGWHASKFKDCLEAFTHGQPDCTDAVISKKSAAALGIENKHHLVSMNPDWAGTHGRQAVWLNDGQLNLRNATLVGISEELTPGPVPFLNGIIGGCMSLSTGDFVGSDDLSEITSEDELRQRVLTYTGMKSGAVFLQKLMSDSQAESMKEQAFVQAWNSFQDYRHIPLFGDQKVLHINMNMGRRMQGTVDVHRFYFHDLLPFVDEELHALWLRIPLEKRQGGWLYQEFFRRHMPEMARVPWSHTGLDLYASDTENEAALGKRMQRLEQQKLLKKLTFGLYNPRNRHAYNHRETWLRKNKAFRRLMLETLGNSGGTGCSWFDQKRINRTFQKFDQGRDFLFRPLMQAATVIIWHDLFLREVHASAGLYSQRKKRDVEPATG